MASPVLSKDRTLIAWSKAPGDWDTSSDPKFARPVDKFRRSAASPKESVGGRGEFENITLTRVWDEARDRALLNQFRTNPDFFNGGVVSLTSLGTDGIPMGAPDTYTGVVLAMTRTGGDANSGDKTFLTVELSIDTAA